MCECNVSKKAPPLCIMGALMKAGALIYENYSYGEHLFGRGTYSAEGAYSIIYGNISLLNDVIIYILSSCMLAKYVNTFETFFE